MTPEEFAREFEKAPKNLMKAKPSELLFAEDYPEGRMQIVCAAMNEDVSELKKAVDTILAQPEGAKHLVRALNNLKTIGHHGSLCFAKAIFDALDSTWDEGTRHLKFMQILDSVSSDLRTGLGWISEKAAQMLDGGQLANDMRLQAWTHWCAAVLRSSPDASPLIEQIGPRRPQNLTRTMTNALKNAFNDAQISWDVRSAAAYLLLGNRIISIDTAQSFAEEGYASFPLEALEGVEILAIAIESDASTLAEYDVIQQKLAQIRQENLILKEMALDNFMEATTAVFSRQADMPKTALDLALALPDYSKMNRMIYSAFVDDLRRSDWLNLAKKHNLLKTLGRIFFKNIALDNPLCTTFSADLVSSLLDNHNADALKAETWIDAAQSHDVEILKSDVEWWIDFCEQI